MAEIEFTQILDQKKPAVMAETDWFGGANGLPDSSKKLVLLGASANFNNTLREVTSIAKGITDYVEGSPMACMIEAALKTNPKVPLYALSYPAGTGAALLDVTMAGTSTAAGVLKVWIGGRLLRVSLASGSTSAAAATAIVAQYTADAYNFPAAITAGAASHFVATAVVLGLAGASIRVRVDCSGTPGLTADTGPGALAISEAPLAAGGGTDADPATALATLQGDDTYELFALGSQDVTPIASCVTHNDFMAAPAVWKPGRTVVGWTGNSATAQTQADTSSNMRIEIVHHENSPRPCFEVAAAAAAAYAANDIRKSADDLPLNWLMPQFLQTDWPTDAEQESDLNQGVTPLYSKRLGNKVMVVRSVHTLHGASLNNNMAEDTRILEISDYVKKSVISAFSGYKGAILKTESAAGLPGTLTPGRATSILAGRLQQLDSRDYIQGVATAAKAGEIVAQQNGDNVDRVDCAYPLNATRSAHLIAIKETYTF
mgnify:CR=1 FL=1